MNLPSPDKVVFGLAVFGMVSTICLIVLTWIQTTDKYYWQHNYERDREGFDYAIMRNRLYRDFLIDRKLWKEFEDYAKVPAVELLPPIVIPDNDNRKEPLPPAWARIKVPPDEAIVINKEIPEPVKG